MGERFRQRKFYSVEVLDEIHGMLLVAHVPMIADR